MSARAVKKVAYRNEYGGNIFVPLPRDLWRSTGRCDCNFCRGRQGFWDTLALPPKGAKNDRPYPVHYPELRRGRGDPAERVPVTPTLSRQIDAGLKEIKVINRNVRRMRGRELAWNE